MILCAALKYKNFIMPCRVHVEGYVLLTKLNPDIAMHERPIEGFITTKGDFLDRIEAYQHAKNCGQLSSYVVGHNVGNKLFVGDLY